MFCILCNVKCRYIHCFYHCIVQSTISLTSAVLLVLLLYYPSWKEKNKTQYSCSLHEPNSLYIMKLWVCVGMHCDALRGSDHAMLRHQGSGSRGNQWQWINQSDEVEGWGYRGEHGGKMVSSAKPYLLWWAVKQRRYTLFRNMGDMQVKAKNCTIFI